MLEGGVDGQADGGLGGSSWAATSGEYARAGEVTPPRVPMNTCTWAPSTSNDGTRATCSNARSPSRWASGSAVHSWTPCRRRWAGKRARVPSSEWQMPWPAVMRLSWPGSIVWTDPSASWWRTWPAKSQVTVCSPVCGWGGTSMPPEAAMSSGP